MTLFRYLFLQMLAPFSLCLVILAFVRSMDIIFRLINLIVDKGVSPYNVGLLLLYIFPQTLEATIPIAAGLAVLIVMVRISLDSEFIAMRAAGIGMRSIMFPLISFGIITTAITLFVTLWARPAGYHAYETEQVRILKTQTSKKIQPGVFNYDFLDKVLLVQEKDDNGELSGIFIADQVLNKRSMVIMSDRGNLEVEETKREILLKLYDGTIHLTEEESENYRIIQFQSLDYIFRLSEITFTKGGHIWGVPTRELIGSTNSNERLELLLRLTNPLACLAFVVAMITLGIMNPRTGKSTAYLYALVVLVVYHIIWTGIFQLIREDKNITPHALWLPAILLSCFGFYNLYKMNYNYSNIFEITGHWRKKFVNESF